MTYFLAGLPFQRLLPPNSPAAWAAWLLLGALLLRWLWKQPRPAAWGRRQWLWALALLALTPVAILLFGLRLPSAGLLPIPALGPPPVAPLLPLLAALPWALAIARLGPVPGVLLAGLSGLLLAVWNTRSPFTPLEHAWLAALYAAALGQAYGTRLFAWLRQPLVAAAALSLLYPLFYVLTAFFWAAGDPVAALDFALAGLVPAALAVAAPLLLAGLVLQILQARGLLARPAAAEQAAPNQRSLEGRLLFTLGPVVLLAFLALAALAWWSASRAAERLLSERVQSAVGVAAGSVPFLLETGQTLIAQLAADPRLPDASPGAAQDVLQTHLRAVPYFEQLFYLDTGGNTVAGHPVPNFTQVSPSVAEVEAVALAIQGLGFQTLSAPPAGPDGEAAQLAFVAAVRNTNGQVRGVLVGRTSLASNPFAQPAVQSLRSLASLGGQGFLLDGDGRIVLAGDPTAMLQPYNGQRGPAPLHYSEAAPDGSRRFVSYLPVTGSNWAVAAQWPARLSQQLALELVLPIGLVLLALAALAFLLLRISLRSVTASLHTLMTEARRLSTGDLQAPLTLSGADEVGRLAAAFESMRQALKARVDESQRLLSVSQGLSASLDASAHIDPILNAALASGAAAARLVLRGGEKGELAGYGLGPAARNVQGLDEQVMELSAKQKRILLTNPARARLKAGSGAALPEAIAAFSLRQGDEHLGVLWLAFDQAQEFENKTIDYLETLAEEAAKAAMNARQYSSASLGRRRLEAAWNAVPDPVLLVDAVQQILFANPAALQALGRPAEAVLGAPLHTLLALPQGEAAAGGIEIELGNAVYQGSIAELQDGGETIGKVVYLRDLSALRQAENARSDFLATLSHDLHDPLDQTKGYVQMLAAQGELNEQQTGYLRKIEHNLENIARLSSNLTDIERVSGLKSLELQAFSLDELIKDVLEELAPRARQKKLDFARHISGTARPLRADRTLLQRALYNLLDNAARFSPREGIVQISSSFTADTVTVAISDQGSGIAPLDLPRIFESRQDAERKSSGLVIVRSIAERHGGRVWAESELGAGSTFFLELPLAPFQTSG
ncbi:MAG: HAMP domain-containing protein [Anaerolineales bacterium]|nr:HAMP domain-containing protein [Anaerolineales bacterium]